MYTNTPRPPSAPSPARRPARRFPLLLSLRLDALIAQLDRPGLPPATRRQLRRVKGAIERLAGVPVKGGR